MHPCTKAGITYIVPRSLIFKTCPYKNPFFLSALYIHTVAVLFDQLYDILVFKLPVSYVTWDGRGGPKCVFVFRNTEQRFIIMIPFVHLCPCMFRNSSEKKCVFVCLGYRMSTPSFGLLMCLQSGCHYASHISSGINWQALQVVAIELTEFQIMCVCVCVWERERSECVCVCDV